MHSLIEIKRIIRIFLPNRFNFVSSFEVYFKMHIDTKVGFFFKFRSINASLDEKKLSWILCIVNITNARTLTALFRRENRKHLGKSGS